MGSCRHALLAACNRSCLRMSSYWRQHSRAHRHRRSH
jgi:hypothetical protein